MSKYIIKNCDCILSSGRCNVKSLIYCQDCIDCRMKQIVGKCKEYITVLEIHKHDTKDCGFDNILQLLDIQEIE